MYQLYIINEYSRAANYGIGTYIDQLIQAVKIIDIRVTVVHLRDVSHSVFCIEEKENIRSIYIPAPQYVNTRVDNEKSQQRYYRNSLYLMLPYIDSTADKIIFHFNFFNASYLALLLKERFSCKIILTVHYMEWSFELLGDVDKLKKSLENPETPQENRIRDSILSEKKFIDKCDHIIAIAEHSYTTLNLVYGVGAERMTLIKHGLQDSYVERSVDEKMSLRKQFCFTEEEKLIVFAGRLDPVKGIMILLKAFKLLFNQDTSLRLIIAGDGNMKRYMEAVSPLWSKVSFTGFVSKDKLYDLYSIADIGVLPSLHEEFGYVALEMMMMGLPLVTSRTTGLKEIVEEGVTGITVPLQSDDDGSASILSDAMTILLRDSFQLQKCRSNGRNRYLTMYENSIFQNKMMTFYSNQ